MKTDFDSNLRRGFTALDLLIVIATIVVIAAMLPFLTKPKHKSGLACVRNLKQIGIGFRLYATDGEPYPEYNPTNKAWQYIQVVGREIGSPKVLVCPEDYQINNRTIALDFESPAILTTNNFAHPIHQNNALSYFHSPDASEEEPGTILAGDRNISTNSSTISGLLTVGKATPSQWTKNPHKNSGHILLADGSARQTTTAKLREAFRINTNITQRLLVP